MTVMVILDGLRISRSQTGFRRPRVLRHTAAVHLVANGTPMSRIAQYLGHTSSAVTERVYAIYGPDHLRQESKILNFADFGKKAV
jgi:integrase